MNHLRPIKKSGFRFKHIIGTGGIGSGIFFKLSDNKTLGRNESRLAELLPVKDYCKLHIVLHYISKLCGAKSKKITVFPIGAVGDDQVGKSLFNEMHTVGIDTTFIKIVPDLSTLHSVCFQYPDNSGCNITALNSASSIVSSNDIINFFQHYKIPAEGELVISLPEVNLDARLKLLEIGRKRGSFNTASIASAEIAEFQRKKGFSNIDLIVLNFDEARMIAESYNRNKRFEDKLEFENINNILLYCTSFLIEQNPEMLIVVTTGSLGSYACWKGKIEYTPVLNVNVKSTAGAGDAFFAGTIIGLCCGLPFFKGHSNSSFSDTIQNSAVELGALLASLSVISFDTINFNINTDYIKRISKLQNIVFSKDFQYVLGI